MSIGDFIKKRRKALGLSADDLAVKIGKNRATIYRYESSYIEKLPSDVLVPLAEALHITPGDLIMKDASPAASDLLPLTADSAVPGLDLSILSYSPPLFYFPLLFPSLAIISIGRR